MASYMGRGAGRGARMCALRAAPSTQDLAYPVPHACAGPHVHFFCCGAAPPGATSSIPDPAPPCYTAPSQFAAAGTAIGVALEDSSTGGRSYSRWVDSVVLIAGGVSALCAAAAICCQVRGLAA